MITNIKSLEKYCKDYKNIKNYEEALKSTLKYDLHHRLEISDNKSRKDLKEENLYYDRPATELIFLEHGEHIRLHKEGENNPMFGKNLSTDTRKKISEAMKGKHRPAFSTEWKQRMSAAQKGKLGPNRGKHWHLENAKRVYTD